MSYTDYWPFRNLFLLLFFLTPLSGCVTQLKKTESVATDETVFVIGVQPSLSLTLVQGKIQNGKFDPINGAGGYANDPEEGYMITKVKPGEVLGLTQVHILRGTLHPRYIACEDKKSMVFNVPKGKIIYLANIQYTENRSGVSLEYLDKYNEATEYVNREYPALRKRLVKWKYELLPVDDSCTETIYIPMPISR